MPRGKHSKDKMFVTRTEWSRDYGGKKGELLSYVRPLAFDCCAMSLGPFETPVCTTEGVVFDILNVVPYIKQHKKNPVTGEPMKAKDLIQLNWAKNADGKYYCPVTCKVFNDHTRIVAIRTTGNVFSADAVEELNLKTKSFEDLLTGEVFSKEDIIKLNDPSDPELCAKRDVNNFIHLKLVREAAVKEAEKASHTSNIRQTLSTQQIFKEISEKRVEEKKARILAQEESTKKALEIEAEGLANKLPIWKRQRILLEDLNEGMKLSTNTMAGSFTSTSQQVSTVSLSREATPYEIDQARYTRLRNLKKKAYVQLQTSHGNINIEVHADLVPRTAENFIGLCAKGYYDGTVFHRSIRHFVIQGGDPEGTGKGGESLWGGKIQDEFHEKLSHEKRGIVAMANSGPHTTASQFYITYKSCKHLDRKHSVFGHVVGGLATLGNMESVATNKEDRPITDIQILKAVVIQSPIDEMEAALETELLNKKEARENLNKKPISTDIQSETDRNRIGWAKDPSPKISAQSSEFSSEKSGNERFIEVGKYIGKKTVLSASRKKDLDEDSADQTLPSFSSNTGIKRKTDSMNGFKDFSNW